MNNTTKNDDGTLTVKVDDCDLGNATIKLSNGHVLAVFGDAELIMSVDDVQNLLDAMKSLQ